MSKTSLYGMKDDAIRDLLLGQRREESNKAVTDYHSRDVAYLVMKLSVLHYIWNMTIAKVGIPDFYVNANEVEKGTGSLPESFWLSSKHRHRSTCSGEEHTAMKTK